MGLLHSGKRNECYFAVNVVYSRCDELGLWAIKLAILALIYSSSCIIPQISKFAEPDILTYLKAHIDTRHLVADKKPLGISTIPRKMTATPAAMSLIPTDVSEYENCIYFDGYKAIELAHERGLDHAVPDLNLLQVCKLYQLVFVAQYPWWLTQEIFLRIPHDGRGPSEEQLREFFFDNIMSNEELMKVFWEATAVNVDQTTKEKLQHDIRDLRKYAEDRGNWEEASERVDKHGMETGYPKVETGSKIDSTAPKVYILDTHADPSWEGPETEVDTFLRWLDYAETCLMLGYKSLFAATPLLKREMELDIRRFEAHIDMNSPASARFGERIKAVEKGITDARELPPAPIDRKRLRNGLRVTGLIYGQNQRARLREAKWNEKIEGYCTTSRVVIPEWFEEDSKTEQ